MPPPGPERAFLDAVQPPLHPAARDTLMAALDAGWADPRRLHREGRAARRLLDEARAVLADGLGLRPDEVSFHSSPAHALARGIEGLRTARRRIGTHLLTGAIDQAVILRTLAPDNLPVGVDRTGRLDPEGWASALTDAVGAPIALAVTAHGNAEVGTVQPIDALAQASSRHHVPFLLDVTSSWGRLPLPGSVQAYAGDAASFSGPPLGVLGVRTGTRFALAGSPSSPEGGRDLSGPWLPMALAAAEAWRQSRADQTDQARLAHALVDRIRRAAAAVTDVEVVGDPDERLPHVVTFSALYADGEALVREFDRRGYAVASGSACTADTLEPSHVLAAMGALTHGNVRITLPMSSVAPHLEAWVDGFCATLPDVVRTVRTQLGTVDL